MPYSTIPALATYIDRIGATELNFRRFMVREWRGPYYYERSLITINPDFSITCTNADHAPTEEEETAIVAALQALADTWPRHTEVSESKIRQLRQVIADHDRTQETELILFEFYNRANDLVRMVQQRRQMPDGNKRYVPWTYWSDGVWRSMEPDGKLPFWKPRHATGKQRVMMHEGAKAACYAQGIADGLQPNHPWAAELADYEHWGVIGGALAPGRSDWADLRRVRPSEFVYVCDNDEPGRKALQIVSECARIPMKGVKFGAGWPYRFDLADPMPAEMFINGRWVGGTLREHYVPATWATEQMRVGNKLVWSIRSEFAEEWWHCVQPEVFVHRDQTGRVLTANEFNSDMRPFASVKEIADLLKRDAANKAASLKYDPSRAPGIYVEGNNVHINTHEMPGIQGEMGDCGPWEHFMEQLCPSPQDRAEFIRWCATLVCRPDIKMMYGMLLISESQGVGKGTVGDKILAPLVGKNNCSFPSESEIVDSNYNYWASHKRLAVVHEIYAGHSAKAYNKLKSIITDNNIVVSQKYMANYVIDNWIHILACSNSLRALKLSSDDRRWFVPAITEILRPRSYWDDFNAWLKFNGGLGKIKWWLEDWLRRNEPVKRGHSAPWSLAKKAVIEEGYSEGMQWVVNFMELAATKMGGVGFWVTDEALREGLRQFVYQGRQTDYLEKASTIRKLCVTHGWHVGAQYLQHQALMSTRGARCKIIATTPELAAINTGEQIAAHPPLDVVAKAREWMGL